MGSQIEVSFALEWAPELDLMGPERFCNGVNLCNIGGQWKGKDKHWKGKITKGMGPRSTEILSY